MEDISWNEGIIHQARLMEFSINLPKANAPEDQIKDSLTTPPPTG